MKRTAFILLSICFIGTIVFAQSKDGEQVKTDNPDAAIIKFEVETHDFGDIDEGPKAAYEFVFTNEGNEPLILKNVKASCGCTTPEWPKEPVLPGQKSKVKAIYNTKGRPGKFTKVITITSNASKATMQIYIKGNVLKTDPKEGIPERAPSLISTPFQN